MGYCVPSGSSTAFFAAAGATSSAEASCCSSKGDSKSGDRRLGCTTWGATHFKAVDDDGGCRTNARAAGVVNESRSRQRTSGVLHMIVWYRKVLNDLGVGVWFSLLREGKMCEGLHQVRRLGWSFSRRRTRTRLSPTLITFRFSVTNPDPAGVLFLKTGSSTMARGDSDHLLLSRFTIITGIP